MTEQDFSKVRTEDLPPGYDYSQDEWWQKGQALLEQLYESKEDPGPLARTVLAIKSKIDEQGMVGFQGSSKPSGPRCRYCKDARYVTKFGELVKCPNCNSDRIVLGAP